jgi:predicted transcriptional regulator YdeE
MTQRDQYPDQHPGQAQAELPGPLQDRPTLHVVGLTITTTADAAPRDIAALWQRAAGLDLLHGPEAFGVYHDYVPGASLGYAVTVGRAARPDEPVPEGLSRVEVPAQRCLAITTDGSIEGVQQAWGEVWQRWPTGGPRAMIADVEHWKMGPEGRPVSAAIYLGMRT